MDTASKVFTRAQEQAAERDAIRQAARDCAPFVLKTLVSPAKLAARECLERNARQGNLLDTDTQTMMLRTQGVLMALEALEDELSRLQK